MSAELINKEQAIEALKKLLPEIEDIIDNDVVQARCEAVVSAIEAIKRLPTFEIH